MTKLVSAIRHVSRINNWSRKRMAMELTGFSTTHRALLMRVRRGSVSGKRKDAHRTRSTKRPAASCKMCSFTHNSTLYRQKKTLAFTRRHSTAHSGEERRDKCADTVANGETREQNPEGGSTIFRSDDVGDRSTHHASGPASKPHQLSKTPGSYLFVSSNISTHPKPESTSLSTKNGIIDPSGCMKYMTENGTPSLAT
jgi:hypothetical protein